MEKLMQELDSAFRLISSIPVSHENVEKMASAKKILRQVFAELAELDKAEKAKPESECSHE